MKKITKSRKRDVEKNYPPKRFVEKLRRLAGQIEQGKSFVIQVAGERVTIPAGAIISLEHERTGKDEELEFQLKWSNDGRKKTKRD